MIDYIGEHLWIGILGQTLIFTAFVGALLAGIAFAFGTNAEEESSDKQRWRSIGRRAFTVHGLSIFTIIGLIFYMMLNRHYEYDYVWGHVSNSLPFRYTFAAFWEGQEGSFLLWLFWHAVLGFILMRTAKVWEQPVLSVLSFAQVFFVFFLLGFYFDGGDPKGTSFAFLGDLYGRSGFVWLLLTGLGMYLYRKAPTHRKVVWAGIAVIPSLLLLVGIFAGVYHLGEVRIGASPFVLLRDMHYAPIFNNKNYLASIEGTGLNPLLQNYWMTIHPPTLFLGFATTVVPFAYAIAGLWKGEHRRWMDPALKWALISAGILGTGIFMGGVWAYEALSFGGYWAWDPVENASLVPWITLVAGIHTTLIARATSYSIKSSYIFYILTFWLIVYSTFLTRSGILGETSVHAFTEMGLEWQLVLFLAAIALFSSFFYYYRRKEIPAPQKEESGYSKEFWLFIGSLVLLFSAGLITITTSIPVVNAVAQLEPFDTIIGWVQGLTAGLKGGAMHNLYTFFDNLASGSIAPPEDVVEHHNNFQLWIGVLVALLSGSVQFLHWKKNTLSGGYGGRLATYIGASAVLATLITYPMMLQSGIQAWQYWLLVGCGWFAVLTNIAYMGAVAKGNLKMAGSVFSHVGFGLMLVGVVFSGALKSALEDPFAGENLNGLLGDLNKQTNKNVLVTKGQRIELTRGYSVKYTDSWVEENRYYFALSFLKKNEYGHVIDSFVTAPNVVYDTVANNQLKFRAANPNTKSYWSQDVFTLAVPDWAFVDPEAEEPIDTSGWESVTVAIGDTFYTSRYYVIYEGNANETYQHPSYTYQEGDIPLTGSLTIRDINTGAAYPVRTLYFIRGQREYGLPTELPELGLDIKLTHILPRQEKVVFEIKDKELKRSYVVIQALIFPGINLVWGGCIMMMVGLIFSGVARIGAKRAANKRQV